MIRIADLLSFVVFLLIQRLKTFWARPRVASRRRLTLLLAHKSKQKRAFAALGTCVGMIAVFLLAIVVAVRVVLRGTETKGALPSGHPRL